MYIVLWRDRVDVLSECTIVQTIEEVGLAYRQKKGVVSGSGSGKGKDNTQKGP
jgi:hypothetical protein